MGADTGVEPDALDDGLRVESLDLGVGVQLVEVADAKGKVCVGEELYGLCLLGAHVEGGYVLLERPLLKQSGESVRGPGHAVDVCDGEDRLVGGAVLVTLHELGDAGHDAAGIEVVVEGFALAKELGEEKKVEFLLAFCGVLDVERPAVSDGYGGLYHHHGVRIDCEHKINDFLDMACVEVVADWVVVCGGGYDDEVGVTVCRGSVESGREVEVLLGEIFLDVLVLDGRLPVVYEVDLLGDDVDCGDVVVLCQQGGYAEADVTGAGYCDIHNDIIFIRLDIRL